MPINLTGTDLVSENFANDPVFSGGVSYAGYTNSRYTNVRAPTAAELSQLQSVLSGVQGHGVITNADIPSNTTITVNVYIHDGSVNASGPQQMAHNSSANAQVAGAGSNTIWIGWDSNFLPSGSINDDHYNILAHEVLHSSRAFDSRAQAIVSSMPNTDIQNMANTLGVSFQDMENALVRAAEHKLIGERLEPAYPGAISSRASEAYIFSSIDDLLAHTSLSQTDFINAARSLSTSLDGSLPDACFDPEVPIDMWPLDPSLKPGPDGIYDQDEVRAKVWKKPIELIEVGDIVVSFDDNDNLVPGPVTRTFQNDAKILLDFHGTRVTPGHVYYRADSKKSHKYETLIDVLRDDGVIKHQDGTLIRAATNVPVGDPQDGFVRAITGTLKSDGSVDVNDAGRIRLGTRFLVGTGKERKSWAVADLIEAGGGVVGDDELIRVDDGEPMPFLWDLGDTLPKPEDFVLACSGTTLEDIYKAAEWESQGPRLPAPMVLDGGAVQPLPHSAKLTMPRNEPLTVQSGRPRRTTRAAQD